MVNKTICFSIIKKIVLTTLFLSWITACFVCGLLSIQRYNQYSFQRPKKIILSALKLFSDGYIDAAEKKISTLSLFNPSFKSFFNGYSALLEKNFSNAKIHFDNVIETFISSKYSPQMGLDIVFSDAICGRLLIAFFEKDHDIAHYLHKIIKNYEITIEQKDFFCNLHNYMAIMEGKNTALKEPCFHLLPDKNWSTFTIKSLLPEPFIILIKIQQLLRENHIQEALKLSTLHKEILSLTPNFQNTHHLIEGILYLKKAKNASPEDKFDYYFKALSILKKITCFNFSLPYISKENAIDEISLLIEDILNTVPSLTIDFLKIIKDWNEEEAICKIAYNLVHHIHSSCSENLFKIHSLLKNSDEKALYLRALFSKIYLEKATHDIKNHQIMQASFFIQSAIDLQEKSLIRNAIKIHADAFSILVRSDSSQLSQVSAYLSLWDYVEDNHEEKAKIQKYIFNEMKHALKSNDWLKAIALGDLSLNFCKHNEFINHDFTIFFQKIFNEACSNNFIDEILHIHEVAKNFDVNLVLQFSPAEISNLWADAQFLYNKRSYDKVEQYCKWVQKIDPNFQDSYNLSALAAINKKPFFEEDNEEPPLYTNFNEYAVIALCSYKPSSFIQ
ncbi:DUF1347 family protein [Candidatus Clavichlamydia salmonicola]|uniref:DUF1347 family protein n=1 Tax=Candidatus Clavichlamydia salmonicola TaxID=469812 RepID=UPI0018913E9B|nr:DUF1347 family protein [Candidatus Clavichlamydia salmonicola]